MTSPKWRWPCAALVIGLFAGQALFAEEPAPAPTSGTGETFSTFQTYDILFSLHEHEIDRLSNVRIAGTSTFGSKTFLRFQTLLNNQLAQGFIDMGAVTIILPTSDRFVTTPEVMLDRQSTNQEKVKEIRTETVREVLREVPPQVEKR